MTEAIDEKLNQRKRDRIRHGQRINEMMVRRCMADAEGRRWVWDQLEEGHVFSQTVNFEPGGHAIMCFAEGKRSRALALLVSVMSLCPQQFVNMLTENSEALKEKQDGRPGSGGSPGTDDADDHGS